MIQLPQWKWIVCLVAAIFGLLFTLPNVLPASTLAQLPSWMPHQKLNLGLDLQGGSYLLLEVDTAALKKERLTNLVEDVRTNLRAKTIAISEPVISGDSVVVRITDPTQIETAFQILSKLGGQLPSGARDLNVTTTSDQRIVLAMPKEALTQQASQAVDQSIEIIRRRVDAIGTKEPNIFRQGIDRVVVEAPGESDPEKLKSIIGQTAKLTFQMVDPTVTPEDIVGHHIPPDAIVLPMQEGPEREIAVKKRALVTGEMLQTAGFAMSQQTGQPVVTFRFNGQGTKRFADASLANVGKRFAIVLDNKVISAPRINEPITGGSGEISGQFTPESASQLALLLRSGALPAPLNVVEQRQVGAELGADAIRAGAVSLAIGAVAIFIFIILAYGLFGVFAAVALLVNGLLLVGFMSLTQSTLTLPGIAGLVLTLAVAVDANVLIYERMRDEAREGRSAVAAVDHGYSLAMPSIADANITSLIAALIMYQFGSGPVKGFALTLAMGVVSSVFTAILVTQVLVGWWFRLARPKKLPI